MHTCDGKVCMLFVILTKLIPSSLHIKLILYPRITALSYRGAYARVCAESSFASFANYMFACLFTTWYVHTKTANLRLHTSART